MRLPIKTDGLMFIAGGAPEPVVRDRSTGEVATDRDTGATMFTVHLTVFIPGDVRPQVWAVKTAGEPKGINQGSPVSLSGLVAIDWENNGRHGISFRADAIATAAVAAPTGKQAA
jgi:hypothetical protein